MADPYISSLANGAAVDHALGLALTALQADDVGTAAAEDVEAFATAAQGALAASAIQPETLAALNHNELPNIQGGDTDDYYHLTLSEYQALMALLE